MNLGTVQKIRTIESSLLNTTKRNFIPTLYSISITVSNGVESASDKGAHFPRLVFPKNEYQPNQDLRTPCNELPLIQFSQALPPGQMLTTHQQRIRSDIPKRFSLETNRSVISTVARLGHPRSSLSLFRSSLSRFHEKY